MFTLPKYKTPDFTEQKFIDAPDAVLMPSPRDKSAPDNFHATSIYPEYFNRQVEVVKNITPAELRTIAARYFTPHTLRSVVVG